MRPQLEVCVDSIRSAKAAIDGGADRLEICSCLPAGGLTPSTGLLKAIRSLNPDIPLMVMIRPRPGDFVYNDLDIAQMLSEIDAIKSEGIADGFVTGGLTASGTIDEVTCLKLIEACHPLPVTFHRAFDLTIDAVQSLEKIIDLGFRRILTSGQSKNAKSGIEVLKILIQRARDRITIMAGCGIDDKNAEKILRETRVREIHSSASKEVRSKMEVAHETVHLGRPAIDDFVWRECDDKVVSSMMSIIKRTVFEFDENNFGSGDDGDHNEKINNLNAINSTNGSMNEINGTNGH